MLEHLVNSYATSGQPLGPLTSLHSCALAFRNLKPTTSKPTGKQLTSKLIDATPPPGAVQKLDLQLGLAGRPTMAESGPESSPANALYTGPADATGEIIDPHGNIAPVIDPRARCRSCIGKPIGPRVPW